jgi:hypothetical protein
VIPTDAITPELADEFAAGVQWLQKHGRPELTIAAAFAEAMGDWIAGLRAEHLRGEHIPRDET